MRWLLTAALLALTACPAAAEQNEAEKLLRAMEDKVHAAKTLQLRCDLSVTDARGQKGRVKCALILGEDDKFRAEVEGKLFGQAVKGYTVSDGKKIRSVDEATAPTAKEDERPPRGVGAYHRAALPRLGFFLTTLEMGRRADQPPDQIKLSDFEKGDKEKVGDRDAQVIRFRVTPRGGGDSLSATLWLDAETGLPAKLALAGGKSDWSDLTETYSEFAIDADVDAKSFELPK